MEIADKYYENLIIQKSEDYNLIIKALNIVERFLVNRQLILVGGMAIDFSLKLKTGRGIYEDNALPDYDFYSYHHHKTAYDLAAILYKQGLRDISVINGLHPSTMRVRVKFQTVADITYVPKKIIENIPTLRYKGFVIIHPHVQMIDQHRALSYPYENKPRETIIGSRPIKDMKRYDMFYEHYPMRILNITNKETPIKKYTMPKKLLNSNICITGFYALNYWMEQAKEIGFETKAYFGKTGSNYEIPEECYGLSIYADNIKEIYDLIVFERNNNKNIKFYNRFLDKLPRKINIDNEIELFDNNQKIAAHKVGDIYIANIQTIMLYLLTNYILLMKLDNTKRSYAFFQGYLQCRHIITWASNRYYTITHPATKEILKQFLPTAEIYGEFSLDESLITSRHKFDIKNKKSKDMKTYSQPSHIYDQDFKNGKIPMFFYYFKTSRSEIFNFDGNECENFL